ncbi:unnamed protein product [Phytophthora fragariaefolia]|uniref:Unnamed protein product n=1 Tax=Phytophthora fragariaefolia TaxID=1490495 RepID=A0A9W6X5M3_9STRA|nr:unnamed protein product [Phytophthora fragariaefolia]
MLRLLAVALIEWRQLVVGAKFKIDPIRVVQEVSGRPPILEYHVDDTEGDLLLTEHEFDLLGRKYVLRLRITGLRSVRSIEESSTGEPNSKRRQCHPPREDLLTSLPSVLPSSSSSRVESIQDARTFSSQNVDTLPSQVGTPDGSLLIANTSGSYAPGTVLRDLRQGRSVPVQDVPDVAALIQAACAEAARVERERLEALAPQHIQQQKAEDDERHDAERAAWAQQAQVGLEVQQQSLPEKLKAAEAARIQELVKSEGVKRETNASAAATAPKFTKTQGARTDAACPKQEPKNKAAPKPDARMSGRNSKPSKNKRPDRDLSPDGSDSNSDSDEDASDSSSSNDSSGEEARSSTKTSSKTKEGSTLLTVRPYVNLNSLEKFDEKVAIGDRKSSWEHFLNMTEQGGRTDKVKLSELRMKMSSGHWNWRGQLPRHVQADWKNPPREFRHKHLKTRTSESERYFTMKQKSGVTPLDFLYRLNEAAAKAGMKFKSPVTKRAQHISDEDLAQVGDYDTSPPNPRDFRADNVHPGRIKPGRPGRAYVVQSDAKSQAAQDGHERFDDEVEAIETGTPEATALPHSVFE